MSAPLKLWRVLVEAEVLVLAPDAVNARELALAAVGRTAGEDTDDRGHALAELHVFPGEEDLGRVADVQRMPGGRAWDVWTRDAAGEPVLLGTTDTDQTIEHVRRAVAGREAA